jgi:hypothetical protein
MSPKIVQNILMMLHRVEVKGKEAIAWCEAVAALEQLHKEMTTPAPAPATPPAPLPDLASDD